jgi:dihydrofolate reductase
MLISMIAAMTPDRVIGANNTMPWHLPADLKHFKSVTLGKPVIMGRRTYESIGKALPGRQNIVVSGQPNYQLADAHVVSNAESAIVKAKMFTQEEVMVIGGGSIYKCFLPQAQRLYLTFIDANLVGDTFFPAYDTDNYWQEVERIQFCKDINNAFDLTFVTLERISST